MSEFEKCKICGNYGWANSHICPPAFACSLYGDFEDEREIHADDAEEAACKFAAKMDSYESELSEEQTVYVRDGDEKVVVFTVYGEYEPSYRAVRL